MGAPVKAGAPFHVWPKGRSLLIKPLKNRLYPSSVDNLTYTQTRDSLPSSGSGREHRVPPGSGHRGRAVGGGIYDDDVAQDCTGMASRPDDGRGGWYRSCRRGLVMTPP